MTTPRAPSIELSAISWSLNMDHPGIYIPNTQRVLMRWRPWIHGAAYDRLSRNTILHLDAFVLRLGDVTKLILDWHEGGTNHVARDAYLVEPDGLTPLWEAGRGVPIMWDVNARHPDYALWARVHKTVLAIAEQVERYGIIGRQWGRVSVLCHYVRQRDTDTEIPRERNHYTPYGSKRGQAQPGKSATGRPVGRPRKPKPLPDWL